MRVIPRRRIVQYRGEVRDIAGLILRGEIRQGPHIKQFEEEFARYIGTKYAIAVASGRAGLYLVLESLSLNRDSGVMLPAYTDESVPAVIRNLGLKPVFVDIDSTTHNIDADCIERKIDKNTKAIIATHIFGRPSAISRIVDIAKRHKVIVIEDCAHAIGAEYSGRRVGSFGTAAYFSFGITKPFNTFGGGMITTDDPEVYSRIREKMSGMDYPNAFTMAKNALISFSLFFATSNPFFSFTIFPLLLSLSIFNKDLIHIYNKTVKQAVISGQAMVKYTNMQALMGIRQLKNIDAQNEMRRRNAALLMSLINTHAQTLKDSEAARPTYYFFVVLTDDAAALARKLLRKGIDTGKHIMRDCAMVFDNDGSCVHTQEAIRESVQIPNHPSLGRDDVAYIAEALTLLLPPDKRNSAVR